MEQHAFKALADPTRRDILRLLANQEMTIAQVSDQFVMTRAAVKKHLVVLGDGGLIRTRAEGRTQVNTFHPEGFSPVHSWIGNFDQFWDARLQKLKSAIEGKTS